MLPNESDKLGTLYKNLVEEGYELPSETAFRKDMSDETKRTKLHSSLIEEGYPLPDFDTFSGDMGFKKKVPTTSDSKTGAANSGSGLNPSQIPPAYSVTVTDPHTTTSGGAPRELNWAEKAIQVGVNQGAMADIVNINNKELSQEDFAEMARLNRETNKISISPEAKAEFDKAEGFDKFKVVAKNPELLGEIMLSSLSSQVRHGLPRVAVGATAGIPLGPGGVGAGVIAGIGVTSLNLEYSNKIMEVLGEMGVDITDAKQLEQSFTDPTKIDKAKELGLKRGIPVALFDVLTAGVSGKVASIPAKTITGKLGTKAAGMAVESVGGGVGELAGQISAGEKIDPVAIGWEMAAELPSGSVEMTMSAMPNKFVKGEPIKTDVAKMVGSLPPDADAAQIIGQQIDVMTTTGELTPEQGAAIIEETGAAIKANQTIPAQVTGVERAEALPIVVEKRELMSGVAALEAQKEVTDPAFHSVIDEQIKELQGQIAEKDKAIKAIVMPEETKVEEKVNETPVEVNETVTEQIEPINTTTNGEETTQGSEGLLETAVTESTASEQTTPNVPGTSTEPVSEVEGDLKSLDELKADVGMVVETGRGEKYTIIRKIPKDNYIKHQGYELIDENGNKKIERLTPNYKISKDRVKLYESEKSFQPILDNEDISDMDFVNEIENINKEIGNQEVDEAIKNVREEQKYDNELSGRGDIESAYEKLRQVVEIAAKNIEPEPEKVYVSKNGEYTVSKTDTGSFQVTNKKGKPVSKYRRKQTLKEFAANLNLDKGEVADLAGVPEGEANRFIAENSSNRRQILETMATMDEKISEDEMDFKERMIAENMQGVSQDSFAEFGDAVHLEGKDNPIKKSFIRRKGKDLDMLAQEIEYAAYGDSDGTRITPADIIDFMLKYPGGTKTFYEQTNPTYAGLRNKFIELTGITPTRELMDRALSEREETDDVGLEPDKQDVGEMIEPKKKKRRFTQQVLKHPEISGEFKAAIKNDQIYYNELPNTLSIAEANAIITALGDTEAIAAIQNPSNKMSGAARAIVGQVLLKKLQEQGDYDSALDLLTHLTEKGTEYGQFIQAFSLFQYLTPEGQMKYAEREVQRQADKRAKEDEKKIKRTQKVVREVVRESINEALVNVGVSKMAVENLNTSEPASFGSKNKVFTKKRYNDALKSIKGVKFFSNPVDPRLLEIAGYYLEGTAFKFTDWAGKMIKKFGNRVIPHLKNIYGELRKQLQSEYPSGSFLSDSEIDTNLETVIVEKEGLVKSAIKAELREMGSTITEVARKHYTEYNDTKQTLSQKLIQDAGLTEENATRLAKAISDEFDKIIAGKKQEMLNRMVKEGGVRKKVVDSLQEELLKTVNLGGFSNVEFLEKWAEVNDYPKLSPENIKEIGKLANKVAESREGFQKVRAMEDLLAYQAKIKGINLWEVATAIWYANILSGPFTHLVNLVSTGMNSFFNYVNVAARNPRSSLNLSRAFWQGAQHGWLVGKDVLRKGYNPIKGKLEVPATLEIIAALQQDEMDYLKIPKVLRKPTKTTANALKYVRRAMVAADVIFYEGLREMRAYEYAKSRAQNSADVILDPTMDEQNSALAMLNKTDADIQRFTEQADQELENDLKEIENDGLPDKDKRIKQALRDRNRRLLELMQLNRNETMADESARFAAKGTYNHIPEGVLGAVAKSINMASSGFPALRFFIPFTNIIANVANESLNYTPYGFARGAMGGSLLNKIPGALESSKVTLTEDEKMHLYTKAIMGTLLMGALYLASQPGDDEEDPLIEITANGYGSTQYQKNEVLKKTGWQPYSLRINYPNGKSSPWVSYQQLPMLLGMAYIGNIRDAQKYRKEKVTDDVLTQWAVAGTNTSRTLLDMTFISSLNTLLNTAMNPQDENAADNLGRTLSTTAKSFVVPNAYNQSFRVMQEVFDIPSKQVKNKLLAPFLKDMPVARNMYFDQINALGEPVIPDNDKFISEEKGSELWQVIVDKDMMNLNPPSQKTLSLPDPVKIENLRDQGKNLKEYRNVKKGLHYVKDLETGKKIPVVESVITDEEYFNFCKIRGEHIKNALEKVINSGKTNILNQDWMTKTEKEGKRKAMQYLIQYREQN